MAMIKIGSARLIATYVSPWVDRNFPASATQAKAPGPSDLDWMEADVDTFTSYFRDVWRNFQFPAGVLASSAVGEHTGAGSVAASAHHIQFMVGRKKLGHPTTTLEKSKEQAAFIGCTAGDIYDNRAGYNGTASNMVSEASSVLASGLGVKEIKEYSDLTFNIEENDLFENYREKYSHRVGDQVVMPSAKLRHLLKMGQVVALNLFNNFDFKLEDPVTYDSPRMYPVDPTKQQGWWAYCKRPFTFGVSNTSYTASIDVPIYVDTDTMTMSAVIDASEIDDAWGRAVTAMKSYNVKLAEAVNLAKVGLLTIASKAPTTRPEATLDDGLTYEQRSYCDDWWKQYLTAANDTNKHASDSKAAQTNDELNAKDGTDISLDERITSSKGSVGDGFNIDWASVLSGTGSLLSSAGSKAFELIKNWGPTGILTAWAGYKAVSSASKSSVPSWLIIGGFAVIAMVLLK